MGKLSRKRKSGNPRGRPSRAHNRAARAECALKAPTMERTNNFNRQAHFTVYNHWYQTDEVLDFVIK